MVRSAAEVDYPPFSDVDAEGRATGFAVELLRASLAAVDRDVTFRVGAWPDVMAALTEGTVDVLPLVGRTPEREPLFDFTFPYMTVHGAIVVRRDETGIMGVEDLSTRRVAVLAGDNAEEYLRREDVAGAILTVYSFVDALFLLQRGEADAVLMQRLLAVHLLRKQEFTNLRILPRRIEAFKQEFCFAVRNGDAELLSLLNEGLALVMADGTHARLMREWFGRPDAPAGRERIRVGGDMAAPPYEYVDADGQPTGGLTAMTHAIAQAMNIQVDVQLRLWSETRRALEDGGIDIIQGLFYSRERERFFSFSPPHHTVHYYAFGRPEADYISDAAALAGVRVAVMDGDIAHDFLLESNVEPILVFATDQENALRLVVEGKADYTVIAKVTAHHWIERNGWKKDIENRSGSLLALEYCYAVRKGDEALLAVFTHGLQVISESGALRDIKVGWYGVEADPDYVFAARVFVYILFGVLVVCGAAFLWIRILRMQVRRQTAVLRESEETFRHLYEDSPDPILLVKDGRIIDCNQASVKLIGAPGKDALLSLSPVDISTETQPDGRPTVEAAPAYMGQAQAEGLARFEWRCKRFDGTAILLEVTLVPITIHNERLLHVTWRDITDERKNEVRLRQLEKMSAIGQLAGGIAHNFNNQLTGVIGYGRLLLDELTDPRLRRFAENLMIGARRSAELTQQILAFARAGQGVHVDFHLHDILTEVMAVLEQSLDKAIVLQESPRAAHDRVNGDPGQIQNAILNLALNARDAMPNGGTLIFETTNRKPDASYYPAVYGEEDMPALFICLTVTDTGTGIPKENLPRIFEPFFTTKEPDKGTGMGLASAYGAVTQHAGTMTVYSEPGLGTTFNIYLPVAESAHPIAPTDPTPAQIEGRHVILLIDDEPVIRDLGVDMLGKLGYDVRVCDSGAAGIAYYREHGREIDLVLLDIVMPGMDGKETYRQLRSLDKDVRVVLASGYNLNGTAKELLQEGILEFAQKPFCMTDLSQVIAEALNNPAG